MLVCWRRSGGNGLAECVAVGSVCLNLFGTIGIFTGM
jgi:hypothetical protein